MDTEFLRTLDRQILLGVFVAFVAASAGAAYYLSSSKKRRGSIPKVQNFSIHSSVWKVELAYSKIKIESLWSFRCGS